MKKSTILLLLLPSIILLSCKTIKFSSKFPEFDDRYYSLFDLKRNQKNLKKLGKVSETKPLQEKSDYKMIPDSTRAEYSKRENDDGLDNFEMDDYYEYMYASRIRRFHHPIITMGYYDPWFTNLYWYSYDPYLFGTSIYTTYHFFNPYIPWGGGFYYSNYPYGFYHAWSPHYGWNSFGYYPNYSPFYYNPWVYNPYGVGGWYQGPYLSYHNGLFFSGFYCNQIYYNSFDQNSYHPPVIYKPDKNGIGSGASFVNKKSSLNEVFSKEIGQAPSIIEAKQTLSQKAASNGGASEKIVSKNPKMVKNAEVLDNQTLKDNNAKNIDESKVITSVYQSNNYKSLPNTNNINQTNSPVEVSGNYPSRNVSNHHLSNEHVIQFKNNELPQAIQTNTPQNANRTVFDFNHPVSAGNSNDLRVGTANKVKEIHFDSENIPLQKNQENHHQISKSPTGIIRKETQPTYEKPVDQGSGFQRPAQPVNQEKQFQKNPSEQNQQSHPPKNRSFHINQTEKINQRPANEGNKIREVSPSRDNGIKQAIPDGRIRNHEQPKMKEGNRR